MILRQTCFNLFIFFIFIFSSSLITLRAQSSLEAPRLVVFIMLDELGNDQLTLLEDRFSGEGFNRLKQKGLVFRDACGHSLSGYSGTHITSLLTGAEPSVHGVISHSWVDNGTGEMQAAYSLRPGIPKGLAVESHVPALPDYLKMLWGEKVQVAGITANNTEMAFALGRSPDYYFELDRDSGRFYNRLTAADDMPEWLSEFNAKGMASLFRQRQWGPQYDISSYHEYAHLISKEEKEDFRSFFYDLSAPKNKDVQAYEPLSASPYGNILVRDMAAAFLMNSNFGQDETPDFLMLGFTNRPWFRTNGGFLSAEKEDMLLRLDKELAQLLNFLDEKYGHDNYLTVLASGSAPSFLSERKGSQYHHSGGLFEPRKATSLLNLYLMALYGQGKWVLGMNAGNLYLNHLLIEEKELDLMTIQSQAAEFLMQVSGIEMAVRGIDLALLSGPGYLHRLMWDNYFPGRSGDVLFTLRPGWSYLNERTGKPQNGVMGLTTLPLIVTGWKVEPGEYYKKTTYAALAPFLLRAFGLDVPAYSQGEVPDSK